MIPASERAFFIGHESALPIYERLREAVCALDEGIEVRVGRSQLSFYGRHMFAAVSFLKARRAAKRPPVYLTLTVGLPFRLDHPRVDVATEPYPGRWTHHLTLSLEAEVDEELMAWVAEAYDFREAKR